MLPIICVNLSTLYLLLGVASRSFIRHKDETSLYYLGRVKKKNKGNLPNSEYQGIQIDYFPKNFWGFNVFFLPQNKKHF